MGSGRPTDVPNIWFVSTENQDDRLCSVIDLHVDLGSLMAALIDLKTGRSARIGTGSENCEILRELKAGKLAGS